MKGITIWYVQLGRWGLNLFLLNILWVLFSLSGLIMLGVFPATAALFAVIRKLSFESNELSIFKLFWERFKTEFFKANIVGYTFLLIGFILYLDLRIIQQLDGILNQILNIILLIMFFLYLVTSLYIFPVLVNFNMRSLSYLKHAFIMTIGRPVQSLLMTIILVFILLLFKLVPGMVPVFGGSLISYIIMQVTSKSFPDFKKT